MATEIRDASGALIGYQLEHTAQQVDDGLEAVNTKAAQTAVDDLAQRVTEMENSGGGSGLTDDAKQALLTCFRNVAWINDQGQSYYDALEGALYPPIRATSITLNTGAVKLKTLGATQQLTATVLPADATDSVVWTSSDTSVATVVDGLVTSVAYGSATITATAGDVSASASVLIAQAELTGIIAVFEQGGATIYDTASLDDLKPMLTVTASYDDGTSQTVTDYTLSGTLEAGTSTITVDYGGKTATFDVTVTVDKSGPVSMSDFIQHTNIKTSGFKHYSDGGDTEFSDSRFPTSNGFTSVSDVFPEDADVQITFAPSTNAFQCWLFGSTNFDNSLTLSAGNGDEYWLQNITPSSDVFAYGWSKASHVFTASVKAGTRLMIMGVSSAAHDIANFTVEVV